MLRFILMLGLLAVAAAARAGLPWQDEARVTGAGSEVQVVYLTSPDCVYCRSWRYLRNGGWARAQANGLAARIMLTEVSKRTLREGIRADHYPEALRGLYAQNPSLGNAIPAWWVLVDGRPVYGAVGETDWDSAIEPLLQDLLKAKTAGGGRVAIKRPALNARWDAAARAGQPLSPDLLPMSHDALRKAVLAYRDLPGPKAMALSEDGEPYYQSGAADIDKRVLTRCASLTAFRCHLLAIDDQTQPWPR